MGSKQTCQQSFLPAERLWLTRPETEEGGSCPLPEPICPHSLVLLSPGWGTEQVHSMISVPTDLNSTLGDYSSPVSSGRPERKWRWNLGALLGEELTAFSSLPTASPVSTTHCLPQGPPTVWSQVITHFSQPHQGMPSSPGEPIPPGSSPSSRSKILALPQVLPCLKFLGRRPRNHPSF